MTNAADIQALSLTALNATSIAEKQQLIAEINESLAADTVVHHAANPVDLEQPGLPDQLELVDPRQVPKRKLSTDEGRACFLHAVAHIECNAINLALDAIYRFAELPGDFYRDWALVAADEARHHNLVVSRIQALGFDYGDFPAHNGLWDIARRTSHSLLDRMALVPCVLEARGLDVTPGMVSRLGQVGEVEGANILSLILREEVGHVAIGLRWYRYACQERGVEPIATFVALCDTHMPGRRQGPYNEADRRAAGFGAEWMAALQALSQPAQTTAQGNTRL